MIVERDIRLQETCIFFSRHNLFPPILGLRHYFKKYLVSPAPKKKISNIVAVSFIDGGN
jgi:hypothetical protein